MLFQETFLLNLLTFVVFPFNGAILQFTDRTINKLHFQTLKASAEKME